MPDGSVPLLIVLIILLLLSAFFSSIETAYSCASRIKLRSLVNCGNKKARRTLDLAENKFDKLLTTILVGNNIVNLTSATISTIFFAKIISNSELSASLISTIVITVAVLIFGEITPKFIAKTYPEKFSIAFYPIIIFFYYLLYPFNFIFSGWKWLISKIFRLKNNDVVTEEEIMTIVEEAEEDGTIKKEETKLIRSVIEFDDLEVGDILVPRVNVVAVEIDTPYSEILKIFKNEGYSRLPVYKETIDQIVGIIHSKDFYNTYLDNMTDINEILQDVYYTTEHVKISNLLKQLQKKSTHLAIVLDEYGGTLGIVTLEDILEELVGEIYDEFDEVINYFKQISSNVYLIDCNAPLNELFEQFNL
ncbi:MAG: HlyC/CorC family transporter, partial [Firmicutes bacterium]|nr:HlyC/CorC family transporter [Candidatus Caballimonas caccae]